MKVKYLFLLLILFFSSKAFCINARDDVSIVDIAQLVSDSSFSEAKRLSLKLLKTEPENDAAWYYLGFCYFYEDNLQKAMECWEKASILDPGNSYYLLPQYNICSFFPALQEYADSLALVMSEKWPKQYNTPYTLCLKGTKESKNGQDSLAALHFQQALTMDPEFTPAVLPLAEIYRVHGNMPAYFSIIPQYLTSTDENVEDKVSYLQYILNHIDGSDYRIYNKNLDTMVDTLLATHPTDSLAIKLAGSWDMATGRDSLAKRHFTDLVSLYPDYSAGWIILMAMEPDYNNRISIGESALKHIKTPTDKAFFYMDLANIYYETGSKKKCFDYLEKAKRIKPHSPMVLNNYAYFLSLEGKNLKKAEKMSREVVAKEPENATYLDTYAYILYLLKDYEGARAYYKKCMVYGGKTSKVILEHYAQTLDALGEKDLANFYRNLAAQAK